MFSPTLRRGKVCLRAKKPTHLRGAATETVAVTPGVWRPERTIGPPEPLPSAHGDGALLAAIDARRALAALIDLNDRLFVFHDDGAGGTGFDAVAATFTFL